jgi:2,3-bisphosphoglycerate-dependent phosphoglycerate mutase
MSDPQPTEVVVIRHGETAWNLEGRIQGHLDSGLSELGLRQAQAIAASFARKRLDRIYSSDLPRALRTAEAIAQAKEIAVVPDARLRERHHGVFQGLTLAQAAERWPADFRLYRSRDIDHAIPDGESLHDRHARAIACLEEIGRASPGQRIAIVTHGGVLDSLFRHIVGLDLAAPRRFDLPNGSRNTLRLSGGEWMLVTWGDVRHLAALRSASPYEF